MLQSLRKWAGGWVAGIFILLIAASFAVWGINDVFIQRDTDVLAVIGEEKITATEFNNARETQMRELQQRFRRRLTPKEAEALGLNRQVLARLVGTASINTHARDLNLGIPDASVVKDVQSDRNFQDSSGKFNNAVFQEALRQAGLTERRFTDNRKSDITRNQITDAMLSNVAVPDVMVRILNEFAEETRKVEYFVFKMDQPETVKEPTDSELEAYYKANIRDYTAPELRKVGVVLLDPADMAKTIEISDADLQQEFEATKQRYEEPERRRIQRITFKNKEDAEKAKADLAKGRSFQDVAKDAGFTEQEIDLGNLIRSQIADPKVRDAAFKLEQGKSSDIIETGLGPAIINVSVIEAGVTADFDKVKDQVRTSIATRKGADKVTTTYEAILEDLGGGADVKQAAENHGAKYVIYDAVDRTGKDADAKVIDAFTGKPALLAALFGNDEGSELEPIDLNNGRYAFADVIKISKERQKPLKEVRQKVVTDYKQTQRNTAVATKAKELTGKANNGTALTELATQSGAEIKTSAAFKRTARIDGIPQSVINQAFSLPKDTTAYASAENQNERIIFRVTEINTPKVVADTLKKTITANLERTRTNDLLAEYIAGLQAKYNVQINETAFGQATGRIPVTNGGRGSY